MPRRRLFSGDGFRGGYPSYPPPSYAASQTTAHRTTTDMMVQTDPAPDQALSDLVDKVGDVLVTLMLLATGAILHALAT